MEKLSVEKKEQRRYFNRTARMENVMSYMWTGKDIGWYFASGDIAYPFAALAMITVLSAIFHAIWNKYYASAMNNFCVALWLFGNLIWMIPEVAHPEDTYYTKDIQKEFIGWAETCFIVSILLILTQMIVFTPMGIITDPKEAGSSSSSSSSASTSSSSSPSSNNDKDGSNMQHQQQQQQQSSQYTQSSFYEERGLVPHFVPSKIILGYGTGPCHTQIDLNWQTYDNLHFLWWVLKDLSWVSNTFSLWFISVFFTVSISIDFIVTCFIAGYTFDGLHHLGTAFWLLGNIVWSFGELWGLGSDSPPTSLFSLTEAYTYRYWAVVMVLLSIIPYIIAYCLECGICLCDQNVTNKRIRSFSASITEDSNGIGGGDDDDDDDGDNRQHNNVLLDGSGGALNIGSLTSRPRVRSILDRSSPAGGNTPPHLTSTTVGIEANNNDGEHVPLLLV